MKAGKAVSPLPASWAKTDKEVPAVRFNKNQCLAQASIVRPVTLNWHKRSVFECLHFISARTFKLPYAFS